MSLNLSVIIPYRHAEGNGLARGIETALAMGAEVCVWFDHTPDEMGGWYYDVHPLLDDSVRWAIGRRGQVKAMNGALMLATRRYVLYHTDDDYAGEGVIELIRYLDDNPSAAFAYGTQQYLGARTDLVVPYQYDDVTIYAHNIPCNAIIYRREVLLALGGYREVHDLPDVSHSEDYEVMLRAHKAGHVGRFVHTQAPVLYYTLSMTRGWANQQAHADVVNEAFKRVHPEFRGSL